MNRTDIEYLNFTWNPAAGCTNGCSYCWARRQAKRQKHNCPKCYAFTPHLHPERLNEPLRKRKPWVIGAVFMGDLFDPAFVLDDGEFVPEAVLKIMDEADWHTFVLLTKQPQRAKRFAFPPNVVLGVSPTDQESADRLIPELLECPAATRIVSIEPMRGAVDLSKFPPFCDRRAPPEEVRAMRRVWPKGLPSNSMNAIWAGMKIDGIILGGQTGPDAVPMDPDWVRKVRDDCQVAGVPFFFKQWGEYLPTLEAQYRHSDDALAGELAIFRRVGRKRAGRMLDGRTHDEVAWTPVRSAECGVRSENAK